MKMSLSFLALFIITSSIAFSSDASGSWLFEANLGATPFNTIDFKTVHISDWQNYGTGSKEGRIELPLGDASTSGFVPNLNLGFGYHFSDNFRWNINVQGGVVDFLDVFSISASTGIGIIPIAEDNYRIGIRGDFGVGLLLGNYGKIEQLEGKMNPVITKQGTFYDGDTLHVFGSVFDYSFGLFTEYNITKNSYIKLELGYLMSGDAAPKIETSTETLEFDDPAIVKNEMGSTEAANIHPQFNFKGIYISIGVGVLLGK